MVVEQNKEIETKKNNYKTCYFFLNVIDKLITRNSRK